MCKNVFWLWPLIIAFAYLDASSGYVCETCEKHPKSCKDVQRRGHNASDVYLIQPKDAPKPFRVLCNMESSGGGWTTLLNRYDGSEDFYVDWNSYKQGFGNLGGEFWLGLQKIYEMTRYEQNELLFELVDWANVHKDAHYDYFGIGGEEEGYILNLLRGYSGSAGDGVTLEAGMKFSTRDRDQDTWSLPCCDHYAGGWWYRNCTWANPTGKYYKDGKSPGNTMGMFWATWHHPFYSLKEVRMMIRPKSRR